MPDRNNTVIVIAGPTAVGKTAVGIAVAKWLGTEIISADSRQCFKEMAIGVARPSPAELAAVPHHFIATHSIHEKITAAVFEQYALEKATEIFHQNRYVVMVGGTGLYIKAFAEGMDQIPPVPPEIHTEVKEQYRMHGLPWLQQQLKTLDPTYAASGEMQNPQRMMRALEVALATGHSILSFRTGEKKDRPFRLVKIVLDIPRPQLYDRINHRVGAMMKAGLLNEVKSLQPYQHLNALQTVGYQEFFDHLNGQIPLTEAVDKIQQHTRHYAKRQLTWFRKDEAYTWLPPDAATVISWLEQYGIKPA